MNVESRIPVKVFALIGTYGRLADGHINDGDYKWALVATHKLEASLATLFKMGMIDIGEYTELRDKYVMPRIEKIRKVEGK